MSLPALYATISAGTIAELAEAAYDIGPLTFACLLHRGINDTYELRGADGRRHIARLSGRRYRGPANLAYETALLTQLKQRGAPVAAPRRDRSGALWRDVEASDGPRGLALYEFVEGRAPLRDLIRTGTPDEATREGLGLLGAALATIHMNAEDYAGPPSRYRADAEHLIAGPLAQLSAAPAIDDATRAGFAAIAEALTKRLDGAAPALSRVHCHGDAHFGNALLQGEAGAARRACWFDFDDAAPGWPAYDLATFLWAMLRHTRSHELNPTSGAIWGSFLAGYRSVRPLADADHGAIGLFVAIRQVWFAGEYASKSDLWGTQTISLDWLKGELALLRHCERLATPA